MARRTLLTEAEIRSFMKLAELRPLGAGQIEEMYGDHDDELREDDDELERELDDTEDELGDEDRVADEEGAELDDMSMDMDADMGAPAGSPGMVSIDDFMSALESALEDVTGEPVETEVALDDTDELDDLEVDDELGAMDDEADEMAGLALGGIGDTEAMMEEEDIVNEVARRVAARLQTKNDNAKMVDQLAERILNRLTSK